VGSIGIEKDAKYFEIGEKRIQQAIEEKSQLLFKSGHTPSLKKPF